MYKGILWCYYEDTNDIVKYPNLLVVKVKCNITGSPLEEVNFTSKSQDNFNHKKEWESRFVNDKRFKNLPFDYYPRGRVEIRNGLVKVFANPVLIGDDQVKELIIRTFELDEVKYNTKWIADNSSHYRFSEENVYFDN